MTHDATSSSRNPTTRTLLTLAAAFALVLALSGSAAANAAPSPSQGITALNSGTALLETAPRFISAISYHCSVEMANDGIAKSEMDWVVENYYLSAVFQDNPDPAEATWRYNGPGLTVVLNLYGNCVTTFRT